jgi:hypothetical protein
MIMTTESHNGHSSAIDVPAFDPYAAAPALRWTKKVPSLYALIFAPTVAGFLIAASSASGLLGGASDFRPLEDIRFAIRGSGLSAAAPFHYSLMRDTPDWIFTIGMAIEIMILIRQWRFIASGLPRLAKNGVLKPLSGDAADSLDEMLGLKGVTKFPAEERLARYVAQLNKRNARRARLYTIMFPALAIGLATLLILAERNRIFSVFTPRDLTAAAKANWRLNAYQHWWASLNHPIGAGTYFVLVTLAIYFIVVQTYVGIYAARIASALPRLAQVDANWVNPDGYYGWGPLHDIFGTVWSSMALYGLMVSVLAIVLGLGGIGWIPACIWFVLVAFYFVVPWAAFRKVEAIAKKRHIEAAEAEAGVMTTKDQDELEARVKRYRDVKMNPMRLGNFQRVPVALSVLLPVVLNLAQPFIQSLVPK